ncbi:MAG: hypothetical protein ABI586_01170 [Candidatus Nanopelagicales bacterium]
MHDLSGGSAATQSVMKAPAWLLVVGICLGVIGGTWVASTLLFWWPSLR